MMKVTIIVDMEKRYEEGIIQCKTKNKLELAVMISMLESTKMKILKFLDDASEGIEVREDKP